MIAGKIAAIAERVPAHVIGDGVLTIKQAGRKDQRRPAPRGRSREGADPDQDRPGRHGLGGRSGATALTTCRADGTMIKLTLTGNMSTGGISIDRTFEAHPENIEIAEEAAQVVGLDIAGIDFIAPDITQPVRETGGGICEVNAAPGFRMHTHPTIGDPQYRREAGDRHAVSRRARRAGSRSLPSPEPTARQRRRG